MAFPWATAWVTGASSGIGRDIALQLSSAGVKVAVTSRSGDKLDELAALSSNIIAVPSDVASLSDMAQAHERIRAEFGQIDLAILNAGVWDQSPASRFDAGRAAASMAVNYGGVANGLEPLIREMVQRKSGHIAIMASVAGYRGLPKAAYYAPGKAAAISLAEVLNGELPRHGIKVSIINPGFVETPMTALNDFPMPFIIKSDDAARRTLRGLAKGKFEIVFPWRMMITMKLMRLLPYPVYFWLMRNVAASAAENRQRSN